MVQEFESTLIQNNFKKVWFQDKSGYWFEKKFKILSHKVKFCADERFFSITYQIKDLRSVIPVLDEQEIRIEPSSIGSIKKWHKKYNLKWKKLQ